LVPAAGTPPWVAAGAAVAGAPAVVGTLTGAWVTVEGLQAAKTIAMSTITAAIFETFSRIKASSFLQNGRWNNQAVFTLYEDVRWCLLLLLSPPPTVLIALKISHMVEDWPFSRFSTRERAVSMLIQTRVHSFLELYT
jgi:hypothetical protein